MSKKLHKVCTALIIVFLAGCSSKYEPRESILDEQKKIDAMKAEKPKPQTVLERQAYEKGVQDILTDMKGKMRARNRFTWDEPIIECGVKIPARTINGMLIPAHEECVQIAPGRWTEEAPTYLPELGAK